MTDEPASIATTRIVDIAAHAACMEAPLVSYRQVAPASRSAAPSPGFMFGAYSADLARALYGQIELPELGCYAIADAAVAPTGIALRDGTAFAGAALNLPAEHVSTITTRLGQTALPVRHVPGPLVPLFGPAEESYAQLLLDYLPRLWLLEQAGHDPESLHYLVPAALPPHIEDVVEALGLPAERLFRYAHWEEVIRTDLLLLPTILRRHDRLSPHFAAATRAWTARILTAPEHDAPDGERIYLATEDGPQNRERLAAVAAEYGMRVVRPEMLGVADRACLFANATHIAGAYGTSMHDSVFARAGTRLLVLRDPVRAAGFLQNGIGAALGHTTGYVFGGTQGFTVDEGDFRRGLEVLMLG